MIFARYISSNYLYFFYAYKTKFIEMDRMLFLMQTDLMISFINCLKIGSYLYRSILSIQQCRCFYTAVISAVTQKDIERYTISETIENLCKPYVRNLRSPRPVPVAQLRGPFRKR